MKGNDKVYDIDIEIEILNEIEMDGLKCVAVTQEGGVNWVRE